MILDFQPHCPVDGTPLTKEASTAEAEVMLPCMNCGREWAVITLPFPDPSTGEFTKLIVMADNVFLRIGNEIMEHVKHVFEPRPVADDEPAPPPADIPDEPMAPRSE